MKMIRLAVAGCLVLGLAALAQAAPDEATNKEKIVGKWEIKTGDLPKGAIVEFEKDGKLKLVVKTEDKTITVDGSYKIDGDKLMVTLKTGDKEKTETLKIKSLDDKELVTVDEKGKTDKFARAK